MAEGPETEKVSFCKYNIAPDTDPRLREQAESSLRFLGLIIFENKLKPGTTPAIQALRAAHLACRMITGDNPLTAVSVARECGLVTQAAHIFSPVFVRGTYYLRYGTMHANNKTSRKSINASFQN